MSIPSRSVNATSYVSVPHSDVLRLIDQVLLGPWKHAAICIALHHECLLTAHDVAGQWTEGDDRPYRSVEWQKGDLWWQGLYMEDIEIGVDVTISPSGLTAPMVFDRSECGLLIETLSELRGLQRKGPIARTHLGQPWSDAEAHDQNIRGLVNAAKVNKRVDVPAFGVNDLRVSGIYQALQAGMSLDSLHMRATCGGRAHLARRDAIASQSPKRSIK